jgi:hypothetical protein
MCKFFLSFHSPLLFFFVLVFIAFHSFSAYFLLPFLSFFFYLCCYLCFSVYVGLSLAYFNLFGIKCLVVVVVEQ